MNDKRLQLLEYIQYIFASQRYIIHDSMWSSTEDETILRMEVRKQESDEIIGCQITFDYKNNLIILAYRPGESIPIRIQNWNNIDLEELAIEFTVSVL